MDNSKELVSRRQPNDKSSVINQITYLSLLFKKIGINEIVLADDVVFSGSVLKTIIDAFKKCNIKVIGIRSAISSRYGYDYFNRILPLGLK